MKSLRNAFLILSSFVFMSFVHAASTSFLDDFEDLNFDGWNVSGTGGSSGVEFANGSNWAFAYTSNSPWYSLTREFNYDANQVLSFDFHPVYANQGRGNYGETMHAAGGFTVSFENSFNIILGSVSFVLPTPGYALPSNSYVIPNSADSYQAPMSDWANLALLNPSSNIASIVLDFWVDGHTAQVPVGSAATARVRFDNVAINAVPIPAAAWLFASSLIGFLGIARRRST